MEEQSKKEKIKILITGLFCLILMISILSYTYSYLVVSDKDNSTVKAEVECYTVNYTKGQDISGSLTPGNDYTSGKNTDIVMYSEPDCGLMRGTLYITTNQNSTMDFTDNALRYTVVENNVIVAQGAVNGETNQIIYNDFTLNNTQTTYKVYIWLDEKREELTVVDETFSGFIHAEAVLESNIPSYVLEESPSISSDTATFLSTPIKRNQIQSIEFINTNNAPENSIGTYDVSLADDNSVLLYYTDNDSNNLYEVMIGTETGTTIASSGAYLFSYLSNMTDVDLTNLDTSKVTDMNRMFIASYKLESLDLSSFDTSKVTSMYAMFYNSISLNSIDVSNFDTSNVTNMRAMFASSSTIGVMSLTEIIGLTNFDTSKVTDMKAMFQLCVKLTSLDLSNFDTSKVTTMSSMFLGNSKNLMSLTSITFSEKFDTSNVTDMSAMFQYCVKLTSLDLSSFNTSNVTNMQGVFYGCVSLTSLDLSSFDTSRVTNMAGMFYNCANLKNLDLSSFDTSRVTIMGDMFYYNINLKTIYVSNQFVTTNVTNSNRMFYNCTSLVGGNQTTFDSTKIDKSYARIDTESTPGYFTDIADKPV